ncbi:hypothetical protein BC827DRAFT_1170362 [Russula dissimulans]|nr:hypothetical protein BC827DRAFT_1170362 [Russula dissimulans]
MFKLLRHFTSSIYPRSDRSWSYEDAKSNAPTIGRKRKMCDEDEDLQESGSTRKRRGQLERQDTSELSELGVKGSKDRDSETDSGVKQVTRDVKEVELKDETERCHADDEKGTIEEASETVDGESSVARPLDPAAATQNDDSPSQEATVTDDKVSADQSEATVVTPSNDPTGDEPHGVEGLTETNADVEEPLVETEEKDFGDVVPEVEVVDTKESDES